MALTRSYSYNSVQPEMPPSAYPRRMYSRAGVRTQEAAPGPIDSENGGMGGYGDPGPGVPGGDPSQSLPATPPATPPAYQTPTAPSYTPQGTSQYSRSYVPGVGRDSRRDPVDMSQDDRDYFNQQGYYLDRSAENRAAQQGGVRDDYRRQADTAYAPLIAGNGGYSQAEQQEIRGNPSQYMTTDDQYASNYLTPDEENGIKGSPWDRAAYYDPADEMARQYDSSARQRGAANAMERGLYEGITPDLGVGDDYSRDARGIISGTASRMRGAVDPTRLRADDNALNQIRMTPQEEQRMVTSAGNTVGNSYRAAADDTTRRARAAGMNPLGIGAARERLENDSAAAKGDAMTNARVAASNARASRAAQAEGIRMQGEESAADRVSGVEQAAGNFEYGARTGMENQRLGAAQDVSNRRMNAAATSGNANIGTERDNANRETQSRQFNTTTGTGIATGIEQDTAARNRDVALNRQATNQGNQASRFGQGMTVDNAQSQRGTQIAGARRQDAQEGRQYLQGQIPIAQQAEQNDYGRQYSNYATQASALNGSRPPDTRTSTVDRALSAGGSALGSYLASQYGLGGGGGTGGTPPFTLGGGMNLFGNPYTDGYGSYGTPGFAGSYSDPAYSPFWGQWD